MNMNSPDNQQTDPEALRKKTSELQSLHDFMSGTLAASELLQGTVDSIQRLYSGQTLTPHSVKAIFGDLSVRILALRPTPAATPTPAPTPAEVRPSIRPKRLTFKLVEEIARQNGYYIEADHPVVDGIRYSVWKKNAAGVLEDSPWGFETLAEAYSLIAQG